MTAIYNDYPYWRYTVSELGVRHGLLGDSPIPNIGPQADQYHKIKGYGETCKFIIDEPVEAKSYMSYSTHIKFLQKMYI